MNLPVVNDCSGCGACCMTMNSPPGFGGVEVMLFATPEDERRFHDAPQEAQDLVFAYYDRIENLPHGEEIPEGPCCWFDAESRRCRFYEHRPSVCREFPVGSEPCLGWRERFGIVED